LFDLKCGYLNGIEFKKDECTVPVDYQLSIPALPGLFYYYKNRIDIEKEEQLMPISYQKLEKLI
ncbi:30625_t:CDS:1, partial [Gigaspora margarita]